MPFTDEGIVSLFRVGLQAVLAELLSCVLLSGI